MRRAAASAVPTMALVALAYCLPATIEIELGGGVEGALGSSGFYDTEGAYPCSPPRPRGPKAGPAGARPLRLPPSRIGAASGCDRGRRTKPHAHSLAAHRDLFPGDFDRGHLELVLEGP